MSEKFVDHLKNIDKLQGLIYQNLMETFNELSDNSSDFDNIGNIGNVRQLKTMILSKLKASTNFVNSQKFKNACITCKSVRILGLLKKEIASKYLSEEEQKSALGEVVTDYKVDKKYTESFYESVQELKTHITKFISSKTLRKQFQLDNSCLQIINREKKLLEEAFPDNKEINTPEWIQDLSEEDLDNLITQTINYLEAQDYKEFLKLIGDK